MQKLIDQTQQQQNPLPEPVTQLSFAAAVAPDLAGLLKKLGIFGSPRREILSKTPPVRTRDVLAWYLFVLSEPGLNRNKLGYVVERARAGDPPPEPFTGFAELSWFCWRMFIVASKLPEYRQLLIPADYTEAFDLWHQIYEVWPLDTLPLGVVGSWMALLMAGMPSLHQTKPCRTMDRMILHLFPLGGGMCN